MLQNITGGKQQKQSLSEFSPFPSQWLLIKPCPGFSCLITNCHKIFLWYCPRWKAVSSVKILSVLGLKIGAHGSELYIFCPFPPTASPPISKEPGGVPRGPPAPCTYIRTTGHTSALLQRQWLVGLHLHLASVAVLFVYMPVTSGSMSSALSLKFWVFLQIWLYLLMKQIWISLFFGVFPSSLGDVTLTTYSVTLSFPIYSGMQCYNQ